MPHLTKEGLYELLSKTRGKLLIEKMDPTTVLSPKEQELLKMYIPMQLGEESAKRMMLVVSEIRDGKRQPLSEQERIELNLKNMQESLNNFLSKFSSATDEEMDSIYDMCERIRASRSGS